MATDWARVLNSKSRKAFDADIASAAKSVAASTGVPEDTLRAAVTALAAKESAFNAGAKGSPLDDGTQALGLLQYRPSTAKSRGIDPLDPKQAILAATRDAAAAFKRGGLVEIAASHFAGEGGAGRGPKTRDYVRDFLDGMAKLGAPAHRVAPSVARTRRPTTPRSPLDVQAPVMPEVGGDNPFAGFDSKLPQMPMAEIGASAPAISAPVGEVGAKMPIAGMDNTNPFEEFAVQRNPEVLAWFEQLIGAADAKTVQG